MKYTLKPLISALVALPLLAQAESGTTQPAPESPAEAPPPPAYVSPVLVYFEADWAKLKTYADRDNDGNITREELRAIPLPLIIGMDKNFKKADANEDNAMSWDEFLILGRAAEEALKRRFEMEDRDQSGGLTLQEAKEATGEVFTHITAHFTGMDIDQSGEVTWEERVIYMQTPASIGPGQAETPPEAAAGTAAQPADASSPAPDATAK